MNVDGYVDGYVDGCRSVTMVKTHVKTNKLCCMLFWFVFPDFRWVHTKRGHWSHRTSKYHPNYWSSAAVRSSGWCPKEVPNEKTMYLSTSSQHDMDLTRYGTSESTSKSSGARQSLGRLPIWAMTLQFDNIYIWVTLYHPTKCWLVKKSISILGCNVYFEHHPK